MAYLIKNVGFELKSFIKGTNKDMILPQIVILDNGLTKWSGYYNKKSNRRYLFENHLEVHNTSGLIVIPKYATDNTFAHEFRHHWQHQYYDWKPSKWSNDYKKISYKKRIINYFTENFFEMDAFLFSLNNPDYVSELWKEWLIKYYEKGK